MRENYERKSDAKGCKVKPSRFLLKKMKSAAIKTLKPPINKKPKIVVILGPTASGKSELAVKIAKKINGEIISADSRQVYKGLNIGTGKVNGKWQKTNGKSFFVYKGVKHHLIDFVSPKKQYTVAQFQKAGKKVIDKLLHLGSFPIICGGTGLYIDSLIYDIKFPEVKPDPKLRKQLEKINVERLFKMLRELDPRRALQIDPKNKRRIIRALEIVIKSGKKVPPLIKKKRFEVLKIGLFPGKKKLFKKIEERLNKRLKAGMVKEAENLHKKGLSYKRMEELGLEYKWISLYLRGLITKKEMANELKKQIQKYAKRQMTWWKKDKEIMWFNSNKLSPKLIRALSNFM